MSRQRKLETPTVSRSVPVNCRFCGQLLGYAFDFGGRPAIETEAVLSHEENECNILREWNRCKE